MTDLQEIKNRLDLVDVVTDYGVQLRKSGRNYAGFCPFHPNTRTPAFFVFPETQTWRCFGACAEGGDVFSFVMKKNGWEFREALVELAKRAGVTLEDSRPKDAAREAAETRQIALLDTASIYYHQLLLHAPQAENVRQYVSRRDLSEETVATFRLGFALDSWDAARSHFNAQGYNDDELLAVGLLTENEERQTRYDRFRGRLMIPIRDLDGRVVGFGARTLDPDGVPKYLNSPQSMLFDKGHLIYGLDMARRHIRDKHEVVLVEGYLDVMTAWQHGFRNVVAQMGTSLTEAQLRLLQKQTKRFILALDSDAAGAKATLRSLQLARETLDRDLDVRFDARGLVQLEGRLKADIRVVTLPEGQDPDSLIRAEPAAWPRLLAEARPVVEYVIQVVAAELPPDDAKAKSAAAAEVLPLIGDIADPVERDHYLNKLAKTLDIGDVNSLRLAADQQKKGQTRRSAARQPAKPRAAPTDDWLPTNIPPEPDMPFDGQPYDGPPGQVSSSGSMLNSGGGTIATRRLRHSTRLEENFLRQCLEHPGAFQAVNYLLGRLAQREVTPADFVRGEDRALLVIIAERSTQPAVAAIDELCDSLDSELAKRVRSLFAKPSTPGMKLDRLPDSLALSVLDWRLEKIREHNTILKSEITRHLPSGGQTELGDELSRSYLDQVQEMKRINHARDAMSASNRRRTD